VLNKSNKNSEQNSNRIMRNTILLSFSRQMDSIEINVLSATISFGIKILNKKFVEIVTVLDLMDLLVEKIRIIKDIL